MPRAHGPLRPTGSSLPWPEMAIEAAALGLFMVSACAFGSLLEYPGSPVHQVIPDPFGRRVLMGLLMGLTAIGLIYSPMGRRSGAHMNPAVTLAFTSLGRVRPGVAAGYAVAQFVGGIAGVALTGALLGTALADPKVHYVVTRPGPQGVAAAFAAEAAISFALLWVVLALARSPRFERFVGVAAGALVALWIVIEAPVSGMSMNPARTLGSAVIAGDATALWLYFVAPPLGMLAAAFLHGRLYARRPSATVAGRCAKLDHHSAVRCIFCDQSPAASTPREPATPRAH